MSRLAVACDGRSADQDAGRPSLRSTQRGMRLTPTVDAGHDPGALDRIDGVFPAEGPWQPDAQEPPRRAALALPLEVGDVRGCVSGPA